MIRPFGVDVDRLRGEARIAAAEVEMVGDRAGEGDELALDEDRRINEHVLQVLPARVRIVGDIEVTVLKALHRINGSAGAKDLGHRAELHRNELGLRHDVAVAIEERGRCIRRLADDRRIGGANELDSHLARGGDEALADDGVINRIEELGPLRQRQSLKHRRPSTLGSCCRFRRARLSSPPGRAASRSGPRGARGPQSAGRT